MTNPHLLTGAYVLDALEADERAAVEAHLLTCPECRTEVAELRSAATSLAALTQTPPPPALRQSVLDAARRARQDPPLVDSPAAAASTTSSPVPTPGPGSEVRADEPTPSGSSVPTSGPDDLTAVRARPRRWRRWVVAAAVAAALLVGITIWRPWATTSAGLAEQVVAAADAQRWSAPVSSGSATGARLTVVRSARLDRAALVLAGLPPAPAGHSYQAWLVNAQGAMTPAGLLPDPTDGTSTLVLPDDADRASAVGLSVEPTGGSTHPTTEPLVVLPMS